MSDLSLNYSPELQGQPGYGDLLVHNGDLVLTSDVNASGTDPTIQNVTQRIRFFLGEWFLNLEAGLPWLQQVLVKGAEPSTVDGLLRDTILGTPGVVALTAFQSNQDPSKRIYSVAFTILTASGRRISSAVPVTVSGASSA